jgi:glycosyltransferase involved in cell wall biosynthesis
MTDRPKILFLHRNTFGQFEFFGKWLAENGWDVTFAMGGKSEDRTNAPYHVRYFPIGEAQVAPDTIRYPLEYATQTAYAAASWMSRMRDSHGYHPDIVVAHVGWGAGLCVKQVWHTCHYIAYHEWYYTDRDWSRGGKAERPLDLPTMVVNRLRNLPITAEFDSADEHWCPTNFQAGRFPPRLREMMAVVPDGVDCTVHAPAANTVLSLPGLDIPKGAPLLTYATRGLEPVRGFPQFMRALSIVQARRPDVHALIVANDQVSYGPSLPNGASWKKLVLETYDFDEDRLHFQPMLPRADYLHVLQASTLHFYFTEPFVTSWSLSEAMAAGCLVIGSLTGPVEEYVEDMVSGILVDMDDPEEIADMVDWAIDHPTEAAVLRGNARQAMMDRFDARHVFPRKAERLRSRLGART